MLYIHITHTHISFNLNTIEKQSVKNKLYGLHK